MRDVVAAAGARLGWTPGQSWTVLPGLALSAPVLVASVVGVLGQSPPTVLPTLSLPAPAAAPPVRPPAAPVAPALPDAPALPPPGALALPPDVGPGLLPGVLPAAPAERPAEDEGPPAPTTSPAPVELVVSDSGYASALGADPTVPGGTLPVQAGPTGELARSFLRLSRRTEVLRLSLDPSQGASYGEAVGGVRACQNVAADWASGGGQQLAAAPEVDAARCVTGVRDGDAYAFDLAALPDPVGAGLSLLSDPAGPAPFRLVFRTLLEDA